MKSQVNALLHVTYGLYEDVHRAYPELKGSLSKDLDRLTLYSRTRGLGLFTLDLPHLESLLLRGLEDGRLALDGPLTRAVSSKTQVPRLFAGLWLRVFERNSCLKHEVDVNALFFLRSFLTIGKRIEVACSNDRIYAKVGEYHDIERNLRKPSFDWSRDELRLDRGEDCCLSKQQLSPGNRHYNGGDLFHPGGFLHIVSEESANIEETCHDVAAIEDRHLSDDHMSVHLVQAVDHRPVDDFPVGTLFHTGTCSDSERSRLEDIRLLNKVQEVSDLIFSTFDAFEPVAFSSWLYERGEGIGFKHGPGAVAEKLKMHEKSCFPNWPQKLQNRFQWELCGKTIGAPLERPSNNEMAARLLAVPKTAKGPRLIAAEPTSHQWCQQLLLRFLFVQCRKTFGSHFIDFKDQGKSGSMVLQASFDRLLATVDLSDASDRLTCWTVERIIRSNSSLLAALHAARTRYIRIDPKINNGELDFLSLRKFASQGTATTFPVMSLVMLCIALASSLGDKERVTWARIKELRTKVRVFGDDIILPVHGYARLVRTMDLLQLKVNMAKSYIHGHFRESCGTDGYKGYNITPTKPKTLVCDSPASCQAVVDTSNNLFNKGLWYASRTADDQLPLSVRKYLRIVGRNEAGFSGFTSFVGSYEYHLAKRWNSCLHRDEVKVRRISSRTSKSERGGFDGLLDFFTRSYDSRNPRVVSESVDLRRTISRLVWEPQNTDARVPHRS
nr:MAG: hypothetical protein 3 [Leviviridae sp.]